MTLEGKLTEELNERKYDLLPHQNWLIRQLFKEYQAQDRERIARALEEIDTKEHECRFNDGEQNCDCFIEALDKALAIVQGTEEEGK